MAVDPVKYTFIRDVTPGMKNLYCQFIVLEIGTPRRTKDGHDVYRIRVADKTGSILLTVWDEIGAALQPSDICRLVNGYVSVHKLSLNITCGRSGEIVKIGEFCMIYSETPFMSATNPDLAKFSDNNPKFHNSNGDNASSSIGEDQQSSSASNQPIDSLKNNKSIKIENNGQAHSFSSAQSAKSHESRDTKGSSNGKSERFSIPANNKLPKLTEKSNINDSQSDLKNDEMKSYKSEGISNNSMNKSFISSNNIVALKIPSLPEIVFQSDKDIDERPNFTFRCRDVDYRPKKFQNRRHPVGFTPRWQPYAPFPGNKRRPYGSSGRLPSICTGPIGHWFPPPRSSFANKSG